MAEKEEIDFTKLSLKDKCYSKNWKARVCAYEDMLKIFMGIDDPKSPEWVKYTNIVRKFPSDSNAAAQEKGLEVTLMFIEKAAVAIKIVPEVLDGIIDKCITAAKCRSKELAVNIILMCVEIEKFETVQEKLMKGMDQKNPKVVAGCLAILCHNLNLFGPKCISVKTLIKRVFPLSEDRDKIIREEVKKLIVELYRWVGNPLRLQLSELKSSVLQELELEFQKIGNNKPVPTRYFRTRQVKRGKMTAEEGYTEDHGTDSCTIEDTAPVVDPFKNLKPVNILSKLPEDFFEKVEASKWQDRKEVLEVLETLVSSNAKLAGGDYSDLVRKLKTLLTKDSNVLVVTLAGKCICGLANGLQKKFTPYAASCISSILVKFKEKKAVVLEVLRAAIDACFAATNFEAIQEDAIQALQNKNPGVKWETLMFLTRTFTKTKINVMMDKKLMKPYFTAIVASINEPDPSVRDAAAMALGIAFNRVGETALTSFLSDLEPMKLLKVKQFAETAAIAKQRVPFVKTLSNSQMIKSNCLETKSSSSEGASSLSMERKDHAVYDQAGVRELSQQKRLHELETNPENSPDAVIRVNISGKLTADLLTALAHKDWKERDEALNKLSKILFEAKFIHGNLGKLPKVLAQRLQDANRIIFTNSFLFCQNLATALGRKCKQHVTTLVPSMLAGLSDSRVVSRANVIACINCWCDNAGVNEFFQGEMIADALKNGNPYLRSELFHWLSIKLNNLENVNKDELISCVPVLLIGIEDRSPDVRKSCHEAILPFMFHLGYETLSRAVVKLRPASKSTIQAVLDKALSDMPSKLQPMTSQVKFVIKDNQTTSTVSARADSNRNVCVVGEATTHNHNGKRAMKSITSLSTKKDTIYNNEDVVKPSLPFNLRKLQRNTEEMSQKILCWNFTTPREEFTDLLKELMGTAGLDKILVANMFHTDFRSHLKALETLAEELFHGIDGTVSNLDLILKWLSIRFYDTNPSVLINSLDYLSQVFKALGENGYKLTDIEASSFVPHLVLKIGEPIDTVRSNVHKIIRQICGVYSCVKVFAFVLDGLKSINTHQICECLDEMAYMISNHKFEVYNGSPEVSLMEIARRISDRDINVRNSALNALTEAYYISGDQIFKWIGQLSDKDVLLLEGIKKAKIPLQLGISQTEVKKGAQSNFNEKVSLTTSDSSSLNLLSGCLKSSSYSRFENDTCAAITSSEEIEDIDQIEIPDFNVYSGKYQIDFESIENLCLSEEVRQELQLDETDTTTAMEVLRSELPVNLSLRRTQTQVIVEASKIEPKVSSSCSAHESIDSVVEQVGCENLELATQALHQLEAMITNLKVSYIMISRVDHLLSMINLQLRRIQPTLGSVSVSKTKEIKKFFSCVITSVSSIYENEMLAKKSGVKSTKELLYYLLILIKDPNINSLPEYCDIAKRMNVLVVPIIEKSDPNAIVCALFRLLNETIFHNPNVNIGELVMKCLWKLIKQMNVWTIEMKPDQWNFRRIATEFQSFMKVHPNRSFVNKNVTPLKTIKTIMHSIVMHLGPTKVRNYLEEMKELRNTDAALFLNKLVNRESTYRLNVQQENENHPQHNQRSLDDTIDSLAVTKIPVSLSNMRQTSKEFFTSLPDVSKASTADAKVSIYLQRLKMIQQRSGIYLPDSDSTEFRMPGSKNC